MSYLNINDFRTFSNGADLSDIEDDELQSILNMASTLIDVETNNYWTYQKNFKEPHDIGTGRMMYWETTPFKSPVRVVTEAFITNALNPNAGDFYKFPLQTTPVGPPNLSVGELPTNFGYVYVDRTRDIISLSYTALQAGIVTQVFPWTSFTHPQLLITYTSGYDDGTVQPDGLSIPAPDWLKQITRLIATNIVFERNLNAQGFAGISQVRQGQTEFRRMGDVQSGSFSIPGEIKLMLKHHHKSVIVGGSGLSNNLR